MSYQPEYDLLYGQISDAVEARTGLRCVRADREPQPGRELLAKVHELILGASVVIADVTERSPNVYYEYGFATAHDRRPILFHCDDITAPTDLVGSEALRYRRNLAENEKFYDTLVACISRELRSPLPEQRRMLVGQNPFPAYIVAAPRVPGQNSKHWWHPDERRTFGDNFGITGILTAYGNLFGTHRLPDLLHAGYIPKDFHETNGNFFCIGSPKVNSMSGRFLELIQQNRRPCWTMPELGDGHDKRVIIQGDPVLDALLAARIERGDDGTAADFGLIVRAPHPAHREHFVLIVAGRHSIGTQAACLMVTQQKLILQLERSLDNFGVVLRDTSQPFWAIVSGELQTDGTVSNAVEIVKAGAYEAA
jgi:hypothetical protein